LSGANRLACPALGLIGRGVLVVGDLRLLFLLTNQLQFSAAEKHNWDWSICSQGSRLAVLVAVPRSLVGGVTAGFAKDEPVRSLGRQDLHSPR